MKKTLVVIKSIVKAKDPGDEVENEVINSEILNSKTFFSQAFRKFANFNARITCDLVFRGFPLFDMTKYLFCRVPPHTN